MSGGQGNMLGGQKNKQEVRKTCSGVKKTFEKPALLLRLAISGGRAETASAPEPCWRGGGVKKKC